jgi:DNA-binding NtrC family response regulator
MAQIAKDAQRGERIAVVVEDDAGQRDLLGAIFEESDVKVLSCDTADEAMRLMEKVGERTVFMFADVSHCGRLTREVEDRWPHTRLVTTAPDVPGRVRRTRRISKPWRALDLIVELERAIAAR